MKANHPSYWPQEFEVVVDNDTVRIDFSLEKLEQTFNVYGIVTDKEGEPLANATIYAQHIATGYYHEIHTDDSGGYSFDIPGGEIWIVSSKIGYKSSGQVYTVTQSFRLDKNLVPE